MSSSSEAGVEGNTRLTSVTGMLLLGLLAVEGVTVLRIHQLITLHIYLGVLLLGPVILKTVSTGYRFLRYYTGAAAYVRKGPPTPVMRVLGPLVIVTSLALLGTGVGLVFVSGRGGLLLTAHKLSFFAWFAVMAVHVLGHLREALVESLAELRKAASGRSVRLLLVAVSLAAGVVAASALLPSASSWTHDDHRRPPYGAPQSRG